MAIRKRPGRASPWQCYWNNPFSGKRESANFVTEEEAQKHDSLIKHRLRFERESFRNEEETEKQDQGITLESAYLLYLREKQFTKSGLAWQLQSMRLALKMFKDKPINEISTEDFTAVMQAHAARDVKQTTVRNRMAVFRAVLRWCANKGLCELIRLPKLPNARSEQFIPPTPAELSAMLAVAEPHIQRVIILGAQSGARIGPSELFRLAWDDVDMAQKLIRIHGARKNLGSPWREVPIRDSLLPLLAKWKDEDKKIGTEHLINFNGRPVTSIKTAWAATLQRAGISRRIRPYDLRHAFATELIAAGVDIGTVAKLMGHSTPTMVLTHYQYVMDKQKRAAVEVLPDVSKHMCPKEKAVREKL